MIFCLLLAIFNYTQMSFLTGKYSIWQQDFYSSFDLAWAEVSFPFLKVKSDHFPRFYGHFSDFSPVACGDTLTSSSWTWKIEFWRENIGIELLKTKTAWKLVKFVIQQDLFELHPSIFEDSMAISLFWHILVILQTSEKSLKWPLRLQKWSDFTFKKRRIKYSSSLIEWAIEILGWIGYLAVKNWHLC